ncbi:hypothetical protein [Cyclobacterium sp.]|uniref:hypothetical protein n=1 Tax=Cyclobacterium sp. TaxID=1966343 RepID=UPI0019955B4A|nr:hypothetical protein [Cyclobacterium sp.]MBD3627605.1 hypothetical protein [Cyclobacterium sp.]
MRKVPASMHRGETGRTIQHKVIWQKQVKESGEAYCRLHLARSACMRVDKWLHILTSSARRLKSAVKL